MKLDKKIREFAFPWDVNLKPDMEADNQNILLDFQNMMMNGIMELNSLHVHRGFFAHALFQSPTDPLQSKFAASVYSAYVHVPTIPFLSKLFPIALQLLVG